MNLFLSKRMALATRNWPRDSCTWGGGLGPGDAPAPRPCPSAGARVPSVLTFPERAGAGRLPVPSHRACCCFPSHMPLCERRSQTPSPAISSFIFLQGIYCRVIGQFLYSLSPYGDGKLQRASPSSTLLTAEAPAPRTESGAQQVLIKCLLSGCKKMKGETGACPRLLAPTPRSLAFCQFQMRLNPSIKPASLGVRHRGSLG